MRYNQIKTAEQVVDEAPMNPTAFAKAIETGQDRGVKVGFEFEVCIPKKSIDAWKSGGQEAEAGAYDPNSLAWVEGKTVKDLVEGFDKWGRKTWRDCLEDLFKHKASVGRDMGTNSVWASYQNWAGKKIAAFKEGQSSGVIKALKEMLKDPKLNDAYEGEGDSATTYKQLAIKSLNEFTGLDFNGKIAMKDLKPAIPKIKQALHNLYYATSRPYDQIFYRAANVDERAESEYRDTFFRSHHSDEGQQERMIQLNIENMVAWANETYGTDNLKELLTTKWAFKARVNNNTDTLKQKLWFFVTPGAEPPQSMQYRSSGNNSYQDGAEFLKANLKSSFGENMVIFTGYHQDTKKLDRWYIEPDGSLRAKDNDTAAEVVSPPLMAKEAMYALNKFYSDAAGMKLYTNSSTGLHINVSIPDTLDVLKLAMFVGDQHVLKTFGRENNSYARSILKNLQGDVSNNSQSYQTLGDTKSQAQKLKSMAERYSGDHFATVNFNGKYVSFRHAGGDYLNKLDEIKNTVGRFIHAMVIASDPDMYREEYLKKVTKLVSKGLPAQDGDPRVDIRANGIPAIMFDVMALPINGEYDLNQSVQAINATMRNNYEDYGIDIVKDPSARDRLQASRGYGSSTKELMTSADDGAFYRVTVFPMDRVQLQRIINQAQLLGDFGDRDTAFGIYPGGGSYRSSSTKAAVGTKWVKRLSQKDRAFAQAYRSIVSGSSAKTKRLPLPEAV